MSLFKIGVLSDGFRLSPQDGVRKAAEIGADGVQVYTVRGEMSPEGMDAAKRSEFRALCDGLGLAISALCGDLGKGLRDAENNPVYVERSKRIADLAVDLGAPVFTTHIGVVPEDAGDEAYQVMLSACREIAGYATSVGITFAIETGPEKATTLKRLLDDVGSKGVGVNLDPANLVMVVADDPVQAVYTLRDYIVHTHAKDGVQLRPWDPTKPWDPEEDKRLGPVCEELPLGEGDVDWPNYLKALKEIGYRGFLTIEREAGADPVGDTVQAIAFLREMQQRVGE